jgi:hypothetical protein
VIPLLSVKSETQLGGQFTVGREPVNYFTRNDPVGPTKQGFLGCCLRTRKKRYVGAGPHATDVW